MSAEQSVSRRKWLGEVAVGLYAGVGAVALSGYVSHEAALAVGRWGGSLDLRLCVSLITPPGSLMVPIAVAVLAWLWLALTRRTSLLTRVACAAVFAAGMITMIGPWGKWSQGPAPWYAQAGVQILLATGLVAVLLLWLPALPARRLPRGNRAVRAVLVLLPASALVLSVEQSVRIESWQGGLEQRLSMIQVPLPPGAARVEDSLRQGRRIIRFTIPDPHPSTAVADFYARYFAAQNWRGGYPGKWRASPGSHPLGGRPVPPSLSYFVTWDSTAVRVVSVLYLSYWAPDGTDPNLPVAQWPSDSLRAQHVKLILMPYTPPPQPQGGPHSPPGELSSPP